jgi:hypothetical protein
LFIKIKFVKLKKIIIRKFKKSAPSIQFLKNRLKRIHLIYMLCFFVKNQSRTAISTTTTTFANLPSQFINPLLFAQPARLVIFLHTTTTFANLPSQFINPFLFAQPARLVIFLHTTTTFANYQSQFINPPFICGI